MNILYLYSLLYTIPIIRLGKRFSVFFLCFDERIVNTILEYFKFSL